MIWHSVNICSFLRYTHKVAVTRTDLLSTWLLFHRCHGECPGLLLIPAVVFHPRDPQSPYKDRRKWTSRIFQLPKAEDVCFPFQCLKLSPRPLHSMQIPRLLLTFCRQTPGQSLPFTCALSIPTPLTHCTHRDPHQLFPISILGSFQTYSPCNSCWESRHLCIQKLESPASVPLSWNLSFDYYWVVSIPLLTCLSFSYLHFSYPFSNELKGVITVLFF